MLKSLSARRAWIEILEGPTTTVVTAKSLSARRAWIEIPLTGRTETIAAVALRKESVDRNCRYSTCCVVLLCRSPQGERG